MKHTIDTSILQELVNKVKTLPYQDVADLLSRTIANARPVPVEAPVAAQPEEKVAE